MTEAEHLAIARRLTWRVLLPGWNSRRLLTLSSPPAPTLPKHCADAPGRLGAAPIPSHPPET